MSQYSGITADQAKAFSSAAPATPPETLSLIENIVGVAAENQQASSARAVVSKSAHTKQGVDYTVLQLTSRGFEVKLGEDGPFYTVDVSW